MGDDFDDKLEPAYADVRAQARDLAARVEPVAVEADASNQLHAGVYDALRDSGLAALTVPAAYGGRFDAVDPLAVCVAREAFMAVSSHLDSVFALQGIGSYAISVGGTDEQRKTWLPRVATAEVLAALALTEPEAGSDLKGLRTSLVERDGELRLDGQKSFISNAGVAGFYTVLAREGDGFSAVLVPADTAGVSVAAVPELIAPHILGDVTFDGVTLPRSARLGEPGRGFDLVLSTLAVFRVSVAGAAVGLAQAALEEAVRHAKKREQFGRPLARLGPVAQMLADCWTEIEMARLLTYRAARRAQHDALASLNYSSMAKLAATETASRVTDRCVQIMGRWGLIRDSKIERLYRQARPMRIYEGASEVLRLGIAQQLCREVD